MHGDGLLILSYDLPDALGVGAGVNVVFSLPIGPGRVLHSQPSPVVPGIHVPAVAFPGEEMQQARGLQFSHCIRWLLSSPSELPALSGGRAAELFLCAGHACERAGPGVVGQRQSVWLFKAQMVRQHRLLRAWV